MIDNVGVLGPQVQFHDPDEIAARLSERVRAERLRREWKQETLAERSGVSLPTIRRYEQTGRTSIQNLLRICHALGRLDEFAPLLAPPRASSIDELEAQSRSNPPQRKRGLR